MSAPGGDPGSCASATGASRAGASTGGASTGSSTGCVSGAVGNQADVGVWSGRGSVNSGSQAGSSVAGALTHVAGTSAPSWDCDCGACDGAAVCGAIGGDDCSASCEGVADSDDEGCGGGAGSASAALVVLTTNARLTPVVAAMRPISGSQRRPVEFVQSRTSEPRMRGSPMSVFLASHPLPVAIRSRPHNQREPDARSTPAEAWVQQVRRRWQDWANRDGVAGIQRDTSTLGASIATSWASSTGPVVLTLRRQRCGQPTTPGVSAPRFTPPSWVLVCPATTRWSTAASGDLAEEVCGLVLGDGDRSLRPGQRDLAVRA